MAMNSGHDDVFGYGVDGGLSGEDDATLAHTDRLLSTLGSGALPEGRDVHEAELLGIFDDWRAEVDREPFPPLPSEEALAAALSPMVVSLADRRAERDGRPGSSRRSRVLRTLTGAAAAVAMVVGGLSVASYDTQPGDALWGVHQSMFAENAEGVELVSSLNQTLDEAETAARDGDHETARELLDSVSAQLADVRKTEDRVSLIQRRDSIERNLHRVVPAPVTSPTAPAGTPGADEPDADGPHPTDVPTTSEPAPPQLTLEPAPPSRPGGEPDAPAPSGPPAPGGQPSPQGELDLPPPNPMMEPAPPQTTPTTTSRPQPSPDGPSPLTTDGQPEETE